MPSAKDIVAHADPEAVKNFTEFISAWWTPIFLFSYTAGIIFFGLGWYYINSDHKRSYGIVCVILSVFLSCLPTIINIFSKTLFNSMAPDKLSYYAPESEYQIYITLAVRGVQLIGLLAVIRSIFFFKDHALEQKPQLLYNGLTYFLGGITCLNFVTVAQFLGKEIGGELEYITSNIF
jgi:hypothetical protein